ncbi:YdeI family protein [Bradyrhizobium sp.]|uniref:YdeI/OmpD-associated family protein n=1 Tax=Bradyrhizobium sp. TaxID=376 RepID=UPI00239E446F|nr:YdeI/OmpD-associated family protein [Bradyrhizobium sp.]MDE1934102.1 YdeI/OmpD-associated family protein [Bradyrhizobium sp.]
MAKTKRDLPIIAFKSQEAWNDWLVSQSADSRGLWLKLAKKSSGIASVSRSEAVDTALCHGWIDGQLDSFDDKYSLVRFTPRRPTSKWSERNCTRALELIALGRMLPAGTKEIERARQDGRWVAAYAPQSTAQVPDDLHVALARNTKAERFFEALDRANRYAILYRVQQAKKPETRAARIKTFVAMLAAGETIHPLKSKR